MSFEVAHREVVSALAVRLDFGCENIAREEKRVRLLERGQAQRFPIATERVSWGGRRLRAAIGTQKPGNVPSVPGFTPALQSRLYTWLYSKPPGAF